MVKMKILPEPSVNMKVSTEIVDLSEEERKAFHSTIEQLEKDVDEAFGAGYTEGEKVGYNNGYTEGETKGIEQGYTEGYAYGTMPIYYANRLEFMWNNVTFPENTNLVLKFAKPVSTHNACFLQTKNIKTIKMISDDKSISVDLSQFVRQSADLELLDLTEYSRDCKSIFMLMYGAVKLKTILGALDLTNCTNVTNAFAADNGLLEEVEFVPNTIKISISFAYLRYLSDKSRQSIIDGLADLTGQTAQTVSFHSNVLAKLTDEQFATILSKNWSV